jgi:adenine phosphoribosyltransferase
MTHNIPLPEEPETVESEYRNFVFGSTVLLLPKLRVSPTCSIYVLNILGGMPDQITTFARDLINGFADQFTSMTMPSLYKHIDAIVSPDGKAIHLTFEVARLLGLPYVILRKHAKPYMGKNLLSSPVISTVTSGYTQFLYLDNKDKMLVKNKNMLFIDDVISSGSTLSATMNLVNYARGTVIGAAALAIEGNYKHIIPTFSLCHLPLEA